MITSSSYSASLQKAERETGSLLDSYLKYPTAENLHSLRTATRKMLTIFQLLPGNAKEKKTEARMQEFDRLLDLTQKARHLDIVLSRITSPDQNKVAESLVKSLGKARDSSLRTVQRLASTLKDAFSKETAMSLDDSTIQKRFDRSTERLAGKIRKLLPSVRKNSIKQKQLHRLRQNSRRLRYLLELSSNPAESEELSALRSWQEPLAAIHDNDACIELLQTRVKSPHVESIVHELTAERGRNLEKFRSIVQEKAAF